MLFGGKTLAQLTEDDLQALVQDSVRESDIIEYKRDMYGGDDESKREMLRDITAMANHKGGSLLIGMDEDDDDGVAIAVLGIERDDHPARVTSSCLANIERRLFGLDVDEVALNNGRVVVAVRIPQSLTGPHMVTFKGLYQFWKRHGRQKERMSVDEIETAFENRINAETRLERFLDERRRRTLALAPNLTTGKQPCLWLTATPVFVGEEFVDISEPAVISSLQSPPSSRLRPSASVFCGAPVPTLSGLRADDTTGNRLEQYLELGRNGHLEFCCLHLWAEDAQGRASIPTPYVAACIESFVALVQTLYEQLQVHSPLQVGISVLNAHGLQLAVPKDFPAPRHARGRRFLEEHLEVPQQYIQEFQRDLSLLPKRLNDRLWNAFGWERCYLYDDDGGIAWNG